jgi:hypothetical protein
LAKVNCRTRTLAENSFLEIERELLELAEYPAERADGWVVGTVEEVAELFRLSRRANLVVRFRDDGFDHITIAWRWLGTSAGLAYMLVRGRVRQVHLMLSSPMDANQRVVDRWIEHPALDLCPGEPALVTLERAGMNDDSACGLLGMLLFAPFCEVCGVVDSA